MQLFDPKYIHCTWDESLKGKLVFYGDIIGDFKEEVEKGDLDSRCICYAYTDNESYPFDIKDVKDIKGAKCSITEWQFVYYDPIYEVKVAYKNGKQVQFKGRISDNWMDNDKWVDCTGTPTWSDSLEWRVKPEKPVVPATEFPSLCGYCIHRLDGCTPKPAGSCVNFFSTNDDYFRVKKDYVDLLEKHTELEHKYYELASGIQGLMHKPVNC